MGLALAIALPALMHPVGLGPALLPMHLPVLLTAALGIAAGLLGPLLGLRVPAIVYVKTAVITGVPGLVVQLVLVPLIVARVSPARYSYRRYCSRSF